MSVQSLKELEQYLETNAKAYKWLTDNNIHWGRKDDKHIHVYTSGYKCHGDLEHYGVEKVLMTYSLRMVSENFDKISGKTVAIYKHK